MKKEDLVMVVLVVFLMLLSLIYYLFLKATGYGAGFEGIWLFIDFVLFFFLIGWMNRKHVLLFLQDHIPKSVLLIGMSLFIMSVLFFIGLEMIMIGNSLYKPKVTLDYLIILGAKVRSDENPSLILKQRLDEAYDYALAHPNTVLIVSGGQGEDEPISEAEAMSRYLVNKGLHKSRVWIEDQSTSTRENGIYSMKLIEQLEKEDIQNSLESPKIGIVSNGFHIFRAKWLFKKLGHPVYGLPAPTVYYMLPHYYLREAAAFIKENMIGFH